MLQMTVGNADRTGSTPTISSSARQVPAVETTSCSVRSDAARVQKTAAEPAMIAIALIPCRG